VTFAEAETTDNTKLYQGDRQSGVSYQILNFQPDAYASSSPGSSNALVRVGKYIDIYVYVRIYINTYLYVRMYVYTYIYNYTYL
jgi:hypothetical protein